MSTEISQGKLESTVLAIDEDFDSDQRIWPKRSGSRVWCGHGRQRRSGVEGELSEIVKKSVQCNRTIENRD